MSIHSCSRIWLHLIWATYKREKVLPTDTARLVSEFLFNYSKEKGIFIEINFVNADHVHLLIDLPVSMQIDNCIKLLKGASSYYINQNNLIAGKFNWGRGYAVFSVSESQKDKVKEYIKGQKEHHRIKSFSEEYQLFIKKYNMNFPITEMD